MIHDVMLKTSKTTQSTIRQKTFENNEQLEWLHLGIISTKNLSKVSTKTRVNYSRAQRTSEHTQRSS